VDDLLDVSRITQGKVQLRTEPMDLEVLVRTAIDTVRHSAEEKGQTLVTDLDGPQFVEVDETRIGQVLGNLLSNSVKYTQEHGTIRVTLRAEDEQAVVSVSDDGRGLHESDLDLIFETFTQLDPESGGLGIGLPLARGLVELHGGTLSVESDGAGRGSVFLARLPLCEGSRPAPPDAPVGRANLTGALRVVVVDDQPDSADSLVMLLTSRGCQATALYSGEQLLERYAELRPHVVFLDLGLPGISGYETAERLRREDRAATTSLVAVTGFGDERAAKRAEVAGFERRLVKPVDIQELQELLLERVRRGL
jgi:CheY-like chemotaxis protein